MIWLVRIPVLALTILIANVAAAFKWAELTADTRLNLSDLFELGMDGAGTIIWLLAIPLSVIAFVLAVIAVIFAHRRKITSLWMFAYTGAAINSGAYYLLKGIAIWTMGPAPFPHPVAELLCMAGAGLFAGVVYWALAGRKPACPATNV